MSPLPEAPARLPRTTPPSYIPEAARFSDETHAFTDPVQVARRLKGIAPVMRALRPTRVDHRHGPSRGAGNWALAYVAFAVSRQPHMKPWWRASLGTDLWKVCGFSDPPGFSTVWERFTELEQNPEAFEAAAHYLIRMARRDAAEVGMWVAIDGTECQTHSQPKHDCGPNDACPGPRSGGQPRFRKVSADEAAVRRREAYATAEPPAQPERPEAGVSGLLPIPEDNYREETADGVRFTSGGHWWRSRDHDAGARSYTDKKAWHGFMCVKATDMHTGAVLAIRIIPAHRQEAHALPEVYAAITDAVGANPIAMVGDKGYSINSVFEFLTARDTTPVFPWRDFAHGRQPVAPAGDRWDRHGIPLCPGCELPGDFVRFSPGGSREGPRIWYRCTMPSTDACSGQHSIATSRAPKRLLPIWRTSPVYAALRSQMGVYERVHEAWRVNYMVGGKTLRDRPRRIGIPCQQLRANAALIVEWLWTSMRQGWIGSGPPRATARQISGRGIHRAILGARRKESLFGGRYPTRSGPAPT